MSSSGASALASSFQQSTRADKEGDMSSVERDAGFCSGGDDEDLEDLHSPTDVSEDSVEVKVQPICLRNKNKRKCAEPRKVASEAKCLTPYKKRRHFLQDETSDVVIPAVDRFHVKQSPDGVTLFANPRSSVSPFRPWSHHSTPPLPCTQVSPPPPQYTERVPELPNQDEPLSLVLKSSGEQNRTAWGLQRRDGSLEDLRVRDSHSIAIKREPPHERLPEHTRRIEETHFDRMPIPLLVGGGRLEDVKRLELSGVREDFKRLQYGSGVIFKREPGQLERYPYGPSVPEASGPGFSRVPETSPSFSREVEAPRGRRTLSEMANEDRVISDVEDLSGRAARTKFNVQSMLSGRCNDDLPGPSSSASTSSDKKASPSGGSQRNYKNMTRERRIEANARERTRVHTISAAFDTLRRTIPAYSHNQKLSKLSVLRIACSYILTLSRVSGSDYSADNSEPSLADCVDMVSRTIQTEGKLRKKKED